MNYLYFLTLTGILSLVSCLPCLSQSSTYPDSKESFAQEANQLILPFVETNNYAGASLVARDNQILFSKAYGKMNQEYDIDNTLQSKFYLASASMMFTAVGMMKLVEKGEIHLEDKVSDYVPEYKHGKKITIEQMLAQRSGIPAIGSDGVVDYDSITKFTHTADQLYQYFKEYDLLFEPGSDYNHGRSEYILLVRIIEKLSKKSFGQFLTEEVFDPLGMHNSGHDPGQASMIPNIAQGYAEKDVSDLETAPFLDWSAKTGHASVYSTVEDLHTFGQAVLNKQLLSEESWNRILKDYGNNVGFGWFIRPHLNKTRYQMNGRSPGFSSYFAIYPDEKLIIVVLSNIYISIPYDIGQALAGLLFNEAVSIPVLSSTLINAEQQRRLIGTYQFDSDFYRPDFPLEITAREGNMYCNWGALVPVDNGNEQPNTFILRPYWSTLKFLADKTGKVSRMTFDRFEGIKVLDRP